MNQPVNGPLGLGHTGSEHNVQSPSDVATQPEQPERQEPEQPERQEPQDELAILDQLEADLAAVEQAITTLEQIATEESVGESAAVHIAAAVPQERFG